MNTYQLLEPVKDGKDYYDMEHAFKTLNRIMGMVKDFDEKFTIIEIVGTSASGKTSFKNMLINCLVKKKEFSTFKTSIYGDCPSKVENEFTNFLPTDKKPRDRVIIIEHSFYPVTQLDYLDSKINSFIEEESGNSLPVYVYLFIDEFDYFLKNREMRESNKKKRNRF